MKREYKFKNVRIVFAVSIALLFILGVFVYFFEYIFPKEVIVNSDPTFIILVIILFFSGCFIMLKIIELFILLLKKTPAIIVTDKYIIDNSRYYSYGKIPWNKIENLNLITTPSGKKYIELHLEREFYTSIKLNMLKKIMLWFDHYGNKSTIYLRKTFVNCNMEEIYIVYNDYKENVNK